jgi:hypothetical protein
LYNVVAKKGCFPPSGAEYGGHTPLGQEFVDLDLKRGCWQVVRNPNDKEKAAFSIGLRLLYFKVMSFGLFNALET